MGSVAFIVGFNGILVANPIVKGPATILLNDPDAIDGAINIIGSKNMSHLAILLLCRLIVYN